MRGSLEVPWIDVSSDRFSDQELQLFESAGYGLTPEPGETPVLLVVDMTYEFCGNPGGSGDDGRRAARTAASPSIANLQALLPAARAGGMPVIYTKNQARPHPIEQGSWGLKTTGQGPIEQLDIVSELAPMDGDLVVQKTKPSAFFGTPLASYLIQMGADSLFVAGATTSGCVRATVTDAFSHNLRTFVLVDCVFDRSPTSHDVSLFDIQQKYAGLLESRALIDWLGS